MKILQICNKSPFSLKDGNSIAMNAIACSLHQNGVDITVLTPCSYHNSEEAESIPLPFHNKYFAIPINFNIGFFQMLNIIFTKKTLQIKRLFNKDFCNKLIELLENNDYDIVQIETVYLASYIATIKTYSKAKIILRSHRIEHLIWERASELRKNIFKKFYLETIARRVKKIELDAIAQVDAIVTITEYDFDHFRMMGFTGNMISLPYGIDVGKLHYTDFGNPENPSFFHIGSMDAGPNQEGISWFLDNVWNLIHIQYPHVKFYLAGHNIPRWIKKKYKKRADVEIVGEVPNAYEFIRSKSVLIVPLMSGSGIRIKIIEGMACGRPIITTSIGAEGISCENKKNISIANTPAQFFDAIENYINHPQLAEKIGMTAQTLIREKYNNKDLILKLIDFYETILRN